MNSTTNVDQIILEMHLTERIAFIIVSIMLLLSSIFLNQKLLCDVGNRMISKCRVIKTLVRLMAYTGYVAGGAQLMTITW